jgi:iron complex outermembrane receptor protein
MKKILFLCIVVLCSLTIDAQHTVSLSIKKSEDKSSLAGATANIVSLNKNATADSSGMVIFTNIPTGTYQVVVSYVGLEEQEVLVQVPQTDNTVLELLLVEGEEVEEEVIITSTRSSRTISDIPTRVEARRYKNATE